MNADAVSSIPHATERTAMTISPRKHEDERRAESDNAVDVARANLSYDPPANRPWRKIAR